MLKRFLLILIFVILGGFSPAPVSAHVLKTDGSIGALLHIDPEDSPVAGQVANFYFEFKDTTGKFDPNNCLCKVMIKENGSPLTEPSFTANQDSTGSFSFNFPRKDVYSVELTGQPSTSTDFKPFKLVYDIRVERGGSTLFTLPFQLDHYVGLGIVLFAFLVFFILGTRRKRKLKKANEK